jgi:hypothetical protein
MIKIQKIESIIIVIPEKMQNSLFSLKEKLRFVFQLILMDLMRCELRLSWNEELKEIISL